MALSQKDNLQGLLHYEYTVQKKVHVKGTLRTYFEKIKSTYDLIVKEERQRVLNFVKFKQTV